MALRSFKMNERKRGRKEGEVNQGAEGDRPGHKVNSKAGIILPKSP